MLFLLSVVLLLPLLVLLRLLLLLLLLLVLVRLLPPQPLQFHLQLLILFLEQMATVAPGNHLSTAKNDSLVSAICQQSKTFHYSVPSVNSQKHFTTLCQLSTVKNISLCHLSTVKKLLYAICQQSKTLVCAR